MKKRLMKKAFYFDGDVNVYSGKTLEEQQEILEEGIKGAGGKVTREDLGDGEKRVLIEFDNGFGISIINRIHSYGVEAALVKDGTVIYDEEEFWDVRGHLDAEELKGLIDYVGGLDKNHASGSEHGYFKKDEDDEEEIK